MTTYTSQPDGTDGIDTLIASPTPTTNFGTNTSIWIGDNSGVNRTLIKFDLSKGTNPPPASATVLSATLTITPVGDYTANARTLSVYRVLRAWVEAQATWNRYATGADWGTAGCANTSTDRESTAIGTAAISASPTLNTGINISLDVAAVQEWVSGAFTNNGMLLKVDTETSDAVQYASSDHATAGYRPKLVIEYALGGQVFIFTGE